MSCVAGCGHAQWQMRRGESRAEAEPATRAYMRAMPLWKDHPRLQET
jgi:hypothetical protein